MTQKADPTVMDGSFECQKATAKAHTGCCADALVAPFVGREGSEITVAIKAEHIGFTKDQLTVTVGEIEAPVTAMKKKTVKHSTLQHADIICKGGKVPRGTYNLRVTSSNQGEASGPGPGFMQPRVEVLGGIDSVSPSKGSVAGGRLATIKGWGFSTKTMVTFGDDAPCEVVSASYDTIECVPPGLQGVNTSTLKAIDAAKTDMRVYVGTETRPKMVLQSAGSNSRTTRVSLSGLRTDIIYTITAGLSVAVWDLEKNVQAFATKTFPTGSANYESHALATFLSKLEANHLVIIASHGDWYTRLTRDLVDQLVACGAPEKLRTDFSELTYGYWDKNSRLVLVGVCSADAVAPGVTTSRFYTSEHDTGDGTIGTGSIDGTAVYMPVADKTKVLTLIADTNVFWKSPIVKKDAYEHDPKLTPTVYSIQPTISSTAGGATVTITGDNFGLEPVVTLGGKICAWKRSDIGSYKKKHLCDWGRNERYGVNCTGIRASTTEIVCITNPIAIEERPIVNTPVRVNVKDKGYALTEEVFTYFDRWSATTTWGYLDPPGEGDLVGILKEDVILYDMSSPALAVLVIEGSMVFDDTRDLELRAKYILVKGQPDRKASFIIGTELHPHQHKAIITLEGNRRMRELPLYGAKVLAVRHAHIDFHGQDRFMWTRLSATGSVFCVMVSISIGCCLVCC